MVQTASRRRTTRRFAGARFLVPSRSFQCSFCIAPWFDFPQLARLGASIQIKGRLLAMKIW